MTAVKFIPVFKYGKLIGHVWKFKGEWHSEYNKTGMTWSGKTKKDAIELLLDQC